MSWRDEQVTIARGRLVGLVLLASAILATSALCLGVLFTAFYPGAAPQLLIALLVLVVLRLAVSLFQTASRYARRNARRRRMRSR